MGKEGVKIDRNQKKKSILSKHLRSDLSEKGTFVTGHENLGYEKCKNACFGVGCT